MAYDNKKKEDGSAGVKKLKDDIKNGTLAPLYVFHGEESYLKEYYRDAIEKQIAASGFAEFNITVFDGGEFNADMLTDAVESLPFGSEKKLIVIRDLDLGGARQEIKDAFLRLFADLPEYICMILYYEAVAYKPDKRLNLFKNLEKCATIVQFDRAKGSELVNWLARRFAAHKKKIGTRECDYIIFLCGSLMTNLITEVEKIAAYAKGEVITREDIDAVASRVLDASVFDLTDCILSQDYKKALAIFRDLMEQKNEPIAVLSALIRQVQRIYAATLAMQAGQGERYIADLYSFRSSYPARLLIDAARKTTPQKAAKALDICCNADIELKSNIPDPERVLELVILRMAEVAV